MENSYGIGITNRYACFIDDGDEVGDPIDILKQVQNEKKAKKVEVAKPNAKAPAPANKESNKKNDNDNKENRTNQRFEGKRVLDARKSQEGPREERNNKVNQEGGPRREVDDEGRGRGRGGRGGGRGMGGRGRGGEGGPRGGAGGGAPRGDGFRGKREFERKSGDNKTGVKAEEKRGGGGKGNWGTMEDELKGETEDGNVTLDENAAAPAKEDAGEKSGEEGAAEDKPKEEEEPKQMTLDEWKASQTKRNEPKFNLRKAGEGADIDPKWKKAAAYKKEKEAGDEDEDEEDDQFVYSQRANRLKHISVDLHFADQQSSGGRGGRGRGRGRGRGGRGGARDGESRRGDKSQQFSLDDKNAFPALG
eukprot:TRINITY_DN523_c0_g1_i1.p1 TRINITY_DN523_c0_g1~~TRINITY_DN523_c0_g1_i1.p1  ORF type:complete len:363 (+),score=157.46 TRINITY_DN523_c0_g1_i1:171-1259(+)